MSTAEDNKALVRRLVEIVNNRDFDAIGEVASGQIAGSLSAVALLGPANAGRTF